MTPEQKERKTENQLSVAEKTGVPEADQCKHGSRGHQVSQILSDKHVAYVLLQKLESVLIFLTQQQRQNQEPRCSVSLHGKCDVTFYTGQQNPSSLCPGS